ncbi:MAG: hypothetical protein USCAAHI_01723 [Beijerinckiaceae bacterium]|nr:MAG: hypothetical protein USCAAHI_01723 [Beijerinckiaceae bacterium]
MWKGNQRGNSKISTGMTGTPRQGSAPNNARSARVKTLAFAAPPCARIAARARRI